MLWDDDHARLIDNQSSLQQIVVKESFEFLIKNFSFQFLAIFSIKY